ncbi:MAG: peptidoglycan bridge formation glycyltransferase FemA/FemB family protein [Anaerolineaceae bacterium]|nr:peptidoglycan bridge formation glycyltransferase FemA/FemB family protein [Anaerolineaceae bacterium]
METCLVTENQKDEWDAIAIRESFFALMQSWEWGNCKEKMGWKTFRIGVEDNGEIIAGAQLLIRNLPLGIGTIAYLPRGPIGNWMDEDIATALFSKINQIAQNNKAIFLRMEPAVAFSEAVNDLLLKNQFKPSKYSIQPKSTIIMDISLSDEDILKNMRKSQKRKITTAERKGVIVRTGCSDDLKDFYKMMLITGKRSGFEPKPFDYYKTEWETFNKENKACFLLASYQDTLIAAHIAYSFGNHAAFFHQVTSGEFANLNSNCLLVWEDIKWAKAQGCVTYDLWGIPDEITETSTEDEESEVERTDGLWGVYKFKRGFSKNIVSYIGTFDYVYKPIIYNSIMNKIINDKTPDKIQIWLNRFRESS